MSDDRFSKVHGSGYDPVNMLREENNQLKLQLQQVNGELINRSVPVIGSVADGLNALTNAAKSGNPVAQGTLKAFFAALDGARDSISIIHIVRH